MLNDAEYGIIPFAVSSAITLTSLSENIYTPQFVPNSLKLFSESPWAGLEPTRPFGSTGNNRMQYQLCLPWNVTWWCLVLGIGFEPTTPYGAAYKAAAFNHSANPALSIILMVARIGIEPILTGLWGQHHPRRHSRIKLLSNLFNKGYYIILGGYGIHRSLYWHDFASWFHLPVCFPHWSPIPLRRDSFHIERFSIFAHQCSLVRFDGIIITQREQLVNNFFHIWWKYFLIKSIGASNWSRTSDPRCFKPML